jgi:hypothetical protein
MSHSGHYEVDIRNNSRKSVDGIALSCKRSDRFAADLTIDGKDLPTSFGTVCEIGTLRPRSSCHVEIWTGNNISRGLFFDRVETDITVTAREFDKIGTRVVIPEYVTSTYFLLNKTLLWRTFWALNIVWWIYLIWIAALWASNTSRSDGNAPQIQNSQSEG